MFLFSRLSLTILNLIGLFLAGSIGESLINFVVIASKERALPALTDFVLHAFRLNRQDFLFSMSPFALLVIANALLSRRYDSIGYLHRYVFIATASIVYFLFFACCLCLPFFVLGVDPEDSWVDIFVLLLDTIILLISVLIYRGRKGIARER